MVIACQDINGCFPQTPVRHNLAQFCFDSRINVFAGLIVHDMHNAFTRGITSMDFFGYLVWIFPDKLRGNVDNALVGSESSGKLVFCGTAELVVKIRHDGNVCAGKAINGLPVVTHRKEFAIRILRQHGA